MMEMVGGQGNVMTHHKTIQDIEQYYGKMGDNKDVKDFIKNMTSDKEGYVSAFIFPLPTWYNNVCSV